MSINSSKKLIQNRYKGRGNSWVKVQSGTLAFEQIIQYITDIGTEADTFKTNINREGFAWLRFSRVEVEQDNLVCSFEVRFKGSKIDHPENIIKFDDSVAKDFSLLGNTPHKLQIEIDPLERKTQNKTVKQKSRIEKSKEDADVADQVITVIREASLSKSTSIELKEWNDWLKINNMYEEHAV